MINCTQCGAFISHYSSNLPNFCSKCLGQTKDVFPGLYQEGRLAGIKEVVGWIEAHTNGDRLELITKFLAISELDWRAKLKEWGIVE